VCISGKLPSGRHKADYAAPLMAAGMRLVDTVTRELDLLVLADPASTSGKAEKARKLGIAVISEEALQARLAAAGVSMPG
jgi:NAD-dependent DNA ligase